jgi:two-component system, chemotaxis family, CheB/CheR fusion protein
VATKTSARSLNGKPARRRKTSTSAKPPAATTLPPSSPCPIVALGASAGGLEAFEHFFAHMPADSGMGFVLVQHLDPSHASMLVEILQRATRMPVVEAAEQMVVEPNHVYVMPPNRDMAIFHGALQLSVPSQPRGVRMPIDAFFRALAEDRGEAAIGIVLSGTGTDGTLGLRAIYGAGGLCLAQDPATAKYDGMPSSAIKAGYVNQVLAVHNMPQALQGGVKAPTLQGPTETATATPADSGLKQILMQLRAGTGHDFSLYKKSTIGRRIERRMAQHGVADAQAYARHIKAHPNELQELFRELLINVTSFFRDPQAFEVLKTSIVPALLDGKADGATVRVWVAGCATGEEVYSVAIVLRECLEQAQRDLKVQIYGTDLDDEAIKAARAGLYPPNVAQDMSPERLRRFFASEAGGFRIKKDVREMAVFATQSVIKDPPFTRLDLLCCRNLLIYLEPELQNRLIPVFHYALNPGGVLFLSPSESIGSHTELFAPIDRKWKFYRAKPGIRSTHALLGARMSWVTGTAPLGGAALAERPSERHVAELAKRTLLQSFTPAAVVTDLQGNVLYVHGDTGKFLRPAPGHPSHNIVDMARDGLQADLREALRRAASQGQATSDLPLTLIGDSQTRSIRLNVRLLPDPDAAHGVLLVSFQEAAPEQAPKAARKPRGKVSAEVLRREELERELVLAKDRMHLLVEEQQASNEELKSINEELQSTNEELQSTNEELETSKEELQSVNEELVTVNSELQTKIEQMSSMQDDMKNLLDNMRLGTIFLDTQLYIRRFTRDATQVFRLVATDVGRPLADIRSELIDGDVLADAQVVLDTLVPTEREARTAAGVWYLVRIQPYRTVDNVIDGVVLTFADVSERINAIAAHKARLLAEAIVDAVAVPHLALDGALCVLSANRAYYRQFGGDEKNTVGQSVFALGERRFDLPPLREMLETAWPTKDGLEHRAIELAPPAGGSSRWKLDARRIAVQPGQADLVLLSIEPVASVAPV